MSFPTEILLTIIDMAIDNNIFGALHPLGSTCHATAAYLTTQHERIMTTFHRAIPIVEYTEDDWTVNGFDEQMPNGLRHGRKMRHRRCENTVEVCEEWHSYGHLYRIDRWIYSTTVFYERSEVDDAGRRHGEYYSSLVGQSGYRLEERRAYYINNRRCGSDLTQVYDGPDQLRRSEMRVWNYDLLLHQDVWNRDA